MNQFETLGAISFIFIVLLLIDNIYKYFRFGINYTIFGSIKYRKRRKKWMKVYGYYHWEYHQAVIQSITNIIKYAYKTWGDVPEIRVIGNHIYTLIDTKEDYDDEVLKNFYQLIQVVNTFPQEEVDKLIKITPKMILPINLGSLYKTGDNYHGSTKNIKRS